MDWDILLTEGLKSECWGQLSIEETVVVLIKAVDNIRTASSTALKSGNTWEFRKDGIVAIVRRDRTNKERYLLTGFADNRDKIKEATVTIAAVNAKYRYTPEFADLYAQVGAVIASDFNLTVPELDVNCCDLQSFNVYQ